MTDMNKGDNSEIGIIFIFSGCLMSRSRLPLQDGRLTRGVCRKYDRQLVEEADKGLIDGAWEQRRVAPLWHQTGLGCLFSWSSNSMYLSWGRGVDWHASLCLFCWSSPTVATPSQVPRSKQLRLSWLQISPISMWRLLWETLMVYSFEGRKCSGF